MSKILKVVAINQHIQGEMGIIEKIKNSPSINDPHYFLIIYIICCKKPNLWKLEISIP
jgi:hypothetical protein